MQPKQKVNILLVDDHPENLVALEAILSSLGQNLVKAHSGEEALKCLLYQDFAVILLDVQMPGMDGFETAALIRSRQKNQNTPIIFLTAFSSSEMLMFKGYSVGAVDYLIKPIVPEILISKVAVFIELFNKTAEVKRQAEQLEVVNNKLGNLLRRQQGKFEAIFKFIPDAVIFLNMDCQISMLNPAFTTLFGYNPEEVIGKEYYTLCENQETCKEQYKILFNLDAQERINPYIATYRRKNGEEFIGETIDTVVQYADGNIIGFLGIIRDITKRKQAEEEIKASLQEKEVLLKEVHHRVKNNLQIIDSLFRHQCRHTKDKQTIEILKECQNRVNSMALLHEKLYQSKDLAKIDFAEYIRSLVATLFHSYSVNTSSDYLKITVDNIFLDIETAIPCGLIINELVSNSLKYAFPAGEKGEININFYADNADTFLLSVKDNGIGLPENFDPHKLQSLGLKLVRSLVRQLGGTIEINGSGGTEFIIKFTKNDN